MKKFRILLRGENYFLDVEGEIKRHGFYTTVFVESPNREEAERKALELIRGDQKLRDALLNDQSDPPMLFTEEIEEIEDVAAFEGFEAKKDRCLGFSFYEGVPTKH